MTPEIKRVMADERLEYNHNEQRAATSFRGAANSNPEMPSPRHIRYVKVVTDFTDAPGTITQPGIRKLLVPALGEPTGDSNFAQHAHSVSDGRRTGTAVKEAFEKFADKTGF